MPSRRLQGKEPDITLDQAQQRRKHPQRQAKSRQKRARVAAAAEAASDAAAVMFGLE